MQPGRFSPLLAGPARIDAIANQHLRLKKSFRSSKFLSAS